MRPHLLISVFVTPHGLNKFRIERVLNDSQTFRVDRFLTACMSMRTIDWQTVRIFLTIDSSWSQFESNIKAALLKIFPIAQFLGDRLERRSDWFKATSFYSQDDLILLQANDDHAFVCQDENYFNDYLSLFSSDHKLLLAGVTHFPEMQVLASRKRVTKTVGKNSPHFVTEVNYAIGTTLVKGSFLNSWWAAGKIMDETKIVRPDNPFGESVSFPYTKMLIPKFELFRHMDGYGHILMHRPLSPLRNLVSLEEFSLSTSSNSEWKLGRWPARLVAYSGEGCDLHQTRNRMTKIDCVTSDIALLQSYWALRLMPGQAQHALQNRNLRTRVYSIFVGVLTALTPPIIRNVPDWAALGVIQFVQVVFKKVFRHEIELPDNVIYLGFSRALVLQLKKMKNQRIEKK